MKRSLKLFLGLCLGLFLGLLLSAGCGSKPPHVVSDTALEEPSVTEEKDEYDDFVELALYPEGKEAPVTSFSEIWGYLIAGSEQPLKSNLPITDVGYFGAEVGTYGTLINVPDRSKIAFYKGRVHLVVTCNGRSLSYFVLKEGTNERKKLIEDLLKATEKYDGLQIDFENVPDRSLNDYFTFLKELREGLKNKMFTVALAARSRDNPEDVYNYKRILPIVDRILVMAYDEHWSGSKPGPIASMGWCQRVAAFSLDTIGKEKLVMGLPFYGRAWESHNHHRAYIHSSIVNLHTTHGSPEITRENGIPTFKYQTNHNVTVYYEDAYSVSARLDMYKRMGVTAVGFWRLGQETPAIWPLLKVE